ncbi:MAG: hypothetical protein IJ634_07080 [Bacteroidales bacterium]|nr:hypothetical protein [Bacteroidales bacterium]
MKSDFDMQWHIRAHELDSSRCPLDGDQLAAIMARAKTATPSLTHTDLFPQTSGIRPLSSLLPLAAAACLALILSPLFRNLHASTEDQVTHRGLQVYFACNNSCNADNVLDALDAKISRT